MDTTALFQESAVEKLSERYPHITIFLPFEPKMQPKSDLKASLKHAFIKVKRDLEKNYQENIACLLLEKLAAIIQDLDFSTHKKSIAIFLSPVFEKVLYLDISISPKILTGRSFKIEQLVDAKKKDDECLVALLTAGKSQVFLGSSREWKTILSATPQSFYSDDDQENMQVYKICSGEYDSPDLLTFIRHASNSLTMLTNAYELPLFVCASKEIIENYKKVSAHAATATCFVTTPNDEIDEPQIKKLLEPMLNNWSQIEHQYILNKLKKAAVNMNLAAGMKEVWNKAMCHRGRLLVIEKNFRQTANIASVDQLIFKAIEPYNKFSYINDPIDDIMEKVFENGGDVEFVEDGFLSDYNGIALI